MKVPLEHPAERKGVAKAWRNALSVGPASVSSGLWSGGESVGGDLGIGEDAALDVDRQCFG